METEVGVGMDVLVVDDEEVVRKVLEAILAEDGLQVHLAGSVKEAEDLCRDSKFDLLVIDKNLPDGNGLELIEKLKDQWAGDCEAVIITGYASLESSVNALRIGVADYVVKPFRDNREICGRLHRAAEKLTIKRENRRLLEELRIKNKELEELATCDPLTGLFNHAYLQERLTKEISRCKRYNHELGLIFVDIDNFKQVNDTLGHQAGDAVLRTISEIFTGKSRDTDYHFRLREHDIAARYGGDEFVLVLPETPMAGTATTAERLRACVEEYNFGSPISPLTISLGIATFPEDGQDRDLLIGAADSALYAAKNSGRNRVISHSPTLDGLDPVDSLEGKSDMNRLTGLKRSLSERAFSFVYQPIFAAKSREILGYEALCRTIDPVFSGPAELLKTAERTGIIKPLGRVLRELAMGPVEKLPDSVCMFINIHSQEIFDPLLKEPEDFMRPWLSRVVLEVSSGHRTIDQGRFQDTLANLRQTGFKIALDGLTDGYLGLDQLLRLRPDYLKLPVGRLLMAETDRASARTNQHLMEVARGESIPVIVCQIESETQMQYAVKLVCDYLQGRHMGKEAPPFS